MKNKSFIFLFVLIFMMVFSLSAVSAADNQTTDSGQVSGDVDVVTVNPWDTTGELTYDIPSDAKAIKSADVYVNVYGGSAKNTYGANANVSLKTVNGENQIASEVLWIEDGSTDGTIYEVNNHTNKCYSDYQMHYDITDFVNGLSNSSISIKVDTFKMDGKEFDGRIKLIALIFAYDDGDADVINYWLDTTQKWSKTNVTTAFDTANSGDIVSAELYNVALSSGDGSYKVNGQILGDAINHTAGNYYQYNYWDVTNNIKKGQNTEILTSYAGTSAYGSIKNVLTLLKTKDLVVDVSLATEYTSVPSCYAGTNNTLTVKVNSNKAGNYTVELLADGVVVDSSEVELDGSDAETVLVTDQTVRPIDETTVSGAENAKVVYSVNVKLNDNVVGNNSVTLPVLYNGYLSKEFAYNATGYEDFDTIAFTGDIVIDIKGESSYASGAAGVNEIWTVEHGNITKAFIYVPYNWFNGKDYIENELMFNVLFNDFAVQPIGFYRDQGNLGKYGKYGYGVLIYDVTDLIKAGDNTFNLTKVNPTPTVYPTALIYAYDAPGSDVNKYAYIINGADVLANDYNKAGRIVNLDTEFDMIPAYNATLYVLASGAQKGEGNIIVNGKVFEDVWNGTTKTTDLFTADVSDVASVCNNISFVATGSTILALPQIMVVAPVLADVSTKTEYTSVPACYAGTNNTLTVTLSANKAGKYVVELLDGTVVVAEADVELDANVPTTVLITDPTIRAVDNTTVSGADNRYVDYTVSVSYEDAVVGSDYLTLPVLYNGYLSKDFAYNATGYEDGCIIAFTGDIVIDIKGESSYASGAAGVNEIWTVAHDNITKAFIYVPYNWFNGKDYIENETMFNVAFNDVNITPVGFYRDQGNLGKYGKYGYGVLIYDVTDLIKAGDNTFNLTKVNPTPTVYPTALIYAYDIPGSDVYKYAFMINGADVLANDYNNAGRIVNLDTEFDVFPAYNATLYVLASSAQKGEGNITVNGKVFEDVWNGTTKTTDLFTADISDVVHACNNISFVATGSTILALPQIMVVAPVLADVSTKTEYTSVPACYAGTNNTLTVTLRANKAGKYVVELFESGVLVAKTDVELDANVSSTVLITDPTIRAVDNTTVSGADNREANYNVIVYYEDVIVGVDYLIIPVLYNGYLSKDFAYNATGYEAIEPITFTGDIVIDVKNESSYASGSTGVNEIWTVAHDNIAKAFIYVPYNWFNGKTYVENEAMFNVAFNDVNITPVAFYRDQGNLGNYGKYGYGVLIYDVTDLIKAGDNTFNLTKVNPTPAVYPTVLVYAYNTPASGVVKTAYIVNGADLLANDYNKAGRVIMVNSQINVSMADVTDATLYVLASGAQSGEGNLGVNNATLVNIWNGTTKTTDLYTVDITNVAKQSNDISFVATGSTILTLPQMIVTTKVAPIETTVTPKALSTTYDSGKAFTITVLDEAKKPVSGLKLTLKVYTGKSTKNYYATTNSKGVASFKDASKLAIGTHKVEITSANKAYNVKKTTSSIKVAKAKTTVKAPKVTAKVKKSKYFKVTVKNKATKKVVKGIKVKIKVYTGKKFKTYTKKTNSKGIAQLNVKSLKVGKHKVVISSGNSKYTISAKSAITIKK